MGKTLEKLGNYFLGLDVIEDYNICRPIKLKSKL